MRRILVDRARQKKALKRGGDLERVDIDAAELPSPMPDDELLALDEALDRLAKVDTRAAEMVKLTFFVGLTQSKTLARSARRLKWRRLLSLLPSRCSFTQFLAD